MAIHGVATTPVTLQLNNTNANASQTQATTKKLAEARSEASEGINDGDETTPAIASAGLAPGVGTNVNKTA